METDWMIFGKISTTCVITVINLVKVTVLIHVIFISADTFSGKQEIGFNHLPIFLFVNNRFFII